MDIDSDDDYRESNSEKENAPSPIYSPRGASPIRGSIPVRRKRRVESSIIPKGSPPLKRMKGNFNAAYLDLLNRDINDAASGLLHGEAEEEEDADQQIGAVMWSTAEKAAFFAAVSRLGRADFTGISARIGTKSELEVHQYLVLLDATEGKGDALRPVDIPAAVEIGAECAAALEAAADALSLCQESYEEQVEKKKWGSRWRVTAQLVETFKKQLRMEKEDQENKSERLDEPPFFQFFRVQNWLLLSNRVFMNSAIPDGNWRAASEEHEPPAIQMTVLSDLYALAVSVTRRLVVSALYVAESRIRRNSFEVVQRKRKTKVSVEDVIAAVSSLGMKQNSNEFWARCARRLQLDVVNDTTGEDIVTDEEDEEDEEHHTDSEQGMDSDDQLSRTVESEPESTEKSGDKEEDDEEYDGDIKMKDQQETSGDDLHLDTMALDIEEAMISLASTESAADGTDTIRAIKSRIKAEHKLEGDAELRDMQASMKAERKLWAILRDHDNTRKD
ncbi:hypothetical protein EV127DRAFT_331180 [Xylaria flabelliformis]|nr:hypothetical protein EV127DRAFT_331180 [Xylaria flabelliformis]